MTFNQKKVVSIVYVLAMFMVSLDGTIVNIALPTISKEFGIDDSLLGTVNVGYLISVAMVLPIAGWLGNRFGTKRIFLIALTTFTIASILCGMSKNLEWLNFFRVVQGAGGGLLTPICMTMLFRNFSPKERPKASRSLVLPIAIAPALGPIIGGILVEYLSWHWIFYINVPFGTLALIIGYFLLIEYKEADTGRFDWKGFFLSVPGLALVMYSLTQGSTKGWTEMEIVLSGLIGLILLVLLVIVELRIEKPLLDLHLFTNKSFRTVGFISVFAAASLHSMLYVLPLMYQKGSSTSALESALIIFPEAIGLMIASRVMPFSYKKYGARTVISIGLIGTILIFIAMSMLESSTNPWVFRTLLFGMGIFLGHTVVVCQFTAFATIPSNLLASATTLSNVQNRLGSAMGIAILGIFLSALGGGQKIDKVNFSFETYQFAMFSSILFLCIALLFVLFLKDSDLELRKPQKVHEE